MDGATAWERYGGRPLHGSDGSHLGDVDEVYLDARTEEPTWAVIHGGLFGSRAVFVPLRGATLDEGRRIDVPWTREAVRDAPSVGADGALSEADQRLLLDHYGAPPETEPEPEAPVEPAGGVERVRYAPLEGHPLHAAAHRAVHQGDLATSMRIIGVHEPPPEDPPA